MLGKRIALTSLFVAAAACGGDASSPVLSAPGGPRLTVGPTVLVVVSCPANLVDGQGGQCSAAGYDSNGAFTTSTASWGTTTPSILGVSGGGVATAVHLASGTGVVSATIGGVTGQASIGVTVSDLAIGIDGPSSIKPNTQCLWWANVSGGTTAYGYSWTSSGGSSTTNELYAQSPSSFTVYLTVTDALGTWRSASQAVTVSSTAHVCPI
jgi:hypothetical protein